ncbi:hypothetical protein D3C71_2079230 [compost metagenome]
MQEIVRLASNVLIGLSLLLWIPMIVAEGRNWPILLGSLVLGILIALGMRSSWIKKWREDEDE